MYTITILRSSPKSLTSLKDMSDAKKCQNLNQQDTVWLVPQKESKLKKIKERKEDLWQSFEDTGQNYQNC